MPQLNSKLFFFNLGGDETRLIARAYFADSERAQAAAARLGFGYRRGGTLTVGGSRALDLYRALPGGTDPALDAALFEFKGTMQKESHEPVNVEARHAAWERLTAVYLNAKKEAGLCV